MDFENFASQIRTVEEQQKWWEENESDLTEDDKQDLFESIVDAGKFDNLEILIRLTLDNSHDSEELIKDLKRIESIVDQDLAWGKFFKDLRKELGDRPEVCEEIYGRLNDEESALLKHIAGLALANFEEEQLVGEVNNLIEEDKISIVESAVKSRYEGEEVPQNIRNSLLEISDNPDYYREFLAASSVLFPQNSKLWNRTIEIAEADHSKVPFVLSNYSYRVSEENTEDYLKLLKIAIEEDQGPVINRFSYILRNDLSNQTEDLADFIIWFSGKNRFKAGRLASQLVEENEDLKQALERKSSDFPNKATTRQVFHSLGLEITDKDIVSFLRTLEDAYVEEDSNKKGELLENAAEKLLGMIDGLKHARNVETRQSEIDILVHNRSVDAMQRMGHPILIECRNRDEKVDPQDVLVLEGKMRNHDAQTGFFICRSGYTEGVEDQIAKCRMTGRNKKIGIINIDDLRELSSKEEIEELVLDKFEEISECG